MHFLGEKTSVKTADSQSALFPTYAKSDFLFGGRI